MKFLKKLLDYLPFDGSKFKIGSIIALIGAIRELVPDLDLQVIIDIVSSNPTTSGIVLALVGLLHKKLKEKYGKKE